MQLAPESLSNKPDGYVRIWMETQSNSKVFFVGYALISASAAVFMFLNNRYGISRLALRESN